MPDEASITTLLKRLGAETGELVRAEVALAKLEFREIARQAAKDGAKLGAAGALTFVGVLALLAWAILGLGDLLGGRHGTVALILGLLLVSIGLLLARSGKKGMARNGPPEETMDTIKDSGHWIVKEASDTARQLREGNRHD